MKQFKNEGLDKYATTQADRDVFKALVDCGGDYEAMSTLLGVKVSSVRNRLHRLRKRAALRAALIHGDDRVFGLDQQRHRVACARTAVADFEINTIACLDNRQRIECDGEG